MKAVVDTNIWISALINKYGYPAKLLNAYINGSFKLVISEPILAELADVLARPRIAKKYKITKDEIDELIMLLKFKAQIVQVSNNINFTKGV